MRTPIFSIIFFLKQIITFLDKITVPLNHLPQCKFYCKMMMSQLNFIQTFIEDLLDLKLIREGTFSLIKEIFDVNETLELI